ARGKLLEENVPDGKQVVSPEVAYVATQMLKGKIERGTGVAATALDRPRAPAWGPGRPAGPPPPRPAPPTTTPTPGSSASRRSLPPACGSATTARAAWARTRRARGSRCRSGQRS